MFKYSIFYLVSLDKTTPKNVSNLQCLSFFPIVLIAETCTSLYLLHVHQWVLVEGKDENKKENLFSERIGKDARFW